MSRSPGRSSARTRLLVVARSLAGGGAERFTSTLLGALDPDRFDIHLALFRQEVAYPLREGIPVTVLGKYRAWHWPRAVFGLRGLMRRLQPQVVLSTISFANQVTGLALLGLRERPRWVARIGAAPEADGGGLRRRLNAALFRGADAVVTNSQGAARSATERYRLPAGRTHTILNPTAFAAIDRMAEEAPETLPEGAGPVVLAVGRLSPEKDPLTLVDAFALVAQQCRARLWFCGSGPLEAAVRARIAERGLASCAHLLGQRSNPFAVMRQADVFALVSRNEGMPNALIEAQALGLPAIVTDCPHGPAEVVLHEATGLVVPVGDVERCAEAMLRLLRSEGLRRAMGQEAAVRVRRAFDLQARMADWAQLIEGLALARAADEPAGARPLP